MRSQFGGEALVRDAPRNTKEWGFQDIPASRRRKVGSAEATRRVRQHSSSDTKGDFFEEIKGRAGCQGKLSEKGLGAQKHHRRKEGLLEVRRVVFALTQDASAGRGHAPRAGRQGKMFKTEAWDDTGGLPTEGERLKEYPGGKKHGSRGGRQTGGRGGT